MSGIRVFLVDDHSVLRQGLRLLIDGQRDMEVVGEFDRGRGVVDAMGGTEADVVVMDISMPDLGGAEAAAAIRQSYPYTKLLALSRHAEKAYVQQMLVAGATGYVLKQTAAEVLIEAIRAVAHGGQYLDPAVGDKTMDAPAASSASSDATLSPREQEIVTMVAYGHTNKEIAALLGIAVKTVEAHKTNVMHKLDLVSRAELVRFALSKGWIER